MLAIPSPKISSMGRIKPPNGPDSNYPQMEIFLSPNVVLSLNGDCHDVSIRIHHQSVGDADGREAVLMFGNGGRPESFGRFE